jgi:hypothetical protein
VAVPGNGIATFGATFPFAVGEKIRSILLFGTFPASTT